MILVPDNNVFFSLMNPYSVNSYLFFSIKSSFSAPDFIKSEFEEHKEVEEFIKFIKFFEYKEFLKKSKDAVNDPDDAPYLAAALSINASIWSNDPHLKEQSLVKVFTTKELINKLLNDEI